MKKEIVQRINQLKKEKKAIILAHYYCNDEVQDIADYLGDSLALSQIAAKTDAEIIVFAGVHFMAETAKILAPSKKVLIPKEEAGCKMADMIDVISLMKYKKDNPNKKIICYVNTTAAVKALVDCCVTSTNALKIIKHYTDLGHDILYCPDKNLGSYAMNQFGSKFETWQGCCPIHDDVTQGDVLEAKKLHPKAIVVAHPECQNSVLELADYVGSTKQILAYVKESNALEFIVCTECGILHQMQKDCPDKKFYMPTTMLCEDMKLTYLEDVLECLEKESNEIILDKEIIQAAKKSLDKMLELS